MLVFTRPIQNRWQAQVSYVLSKTEGSVNNGGTTGAQQLSIETPEHHPDQPRRPRASRSPARVQGIRGLSDTEGRSCRSTRFIAGPVASLIRHSVASHRARSTGPRASTSGSRSRGAIGSIRCTSSTCDSRRSSTPGYNRFGVYADIENLFNVGTAITAQTRFPSAAISGNAVLFGSPSAVTPARQVTFGARWSF